MRVNVAAAAVDGVGVAAMAEGIGEAAENGEQRAAAFELLEVSHRQADQRDKIGRGPFAIHVGFAECDIAAEHRAREEALVVDDERRVEWSAGIAEAMDLAAGDEIQRSAAQAFQHFEKQLLHDAFCLRRAGCVWTGTRFIHRRSASQ